MAASPLWDPLCRTGVSPWVRLFASLSREPTISRRAIFFAFLWLLLISAPERSHATTEDRINRAIALSVPTQSALVELRRLGRDDPAQLARLESQLKTRMRLRALQCGQSYTIPAGASDEDIRRDHGTDPCFARFDSELAEWMGLHSVGFLLAQAPLRPSTTTGPKYISEQAADIQFVRFASKASVAAISSYRDLEIVDLSSGAALLTLPGPRDELLQSISPNGRIFTTLSRAEIRFYSVETGALIVAPRWCYISNQCGFHWLDERSVMRYSNDLRMAQVYDFQSEAQATVAGVTEPVARVLPLLGDRGRFAAVASGGLTGFQLAYGKGEPYFEVRNLTPMHLNLTPNGYGGISTDDRHYVFCSDGKLYIVSTEDLSTEIVDLGSFFVQSVVPSSDSDKIVFAGYVTGGTTTWRFYLYSIHDRTVAAIDTDKLPGTRFEFDTPRKALSVVVGANLATVDALSTRPPIDRDRFRANANATSSGLQHHETESLAPGVVGVVTSGGQIREIIRGPSPEPVTGPMMALAKDAVIEGIGVYGADSPNAGQDHGREDQATRIEGSDVTVRESGGPPGGSVSAQAQVGTIEIRIGAGSKPIVLVLSSFERVLWHVSIERGARLKAILLTGMHGSSVSGQGGVPVVSIGSAYSYTLGTVEYSHLQDEIYTWTGRRMTLFQCARRATDFLVTSALDDSDP